MTRNMRIQTYRINRYVGKVLTNVHVGLRTAYTIRRQSTDECTCGPTHSLHNTAII